LTGRPRPGARLFTLTRLAASLDALLALRPLQQSTNPASLCVAMSGGLDSTLLLVALARLFEQRKAAGGLRAIHVDHGLHPDSASWAAACREQARACAVPYDELRIVVPRGSGESPEAAARGARYAALAARLAAGEVLLTAHHADDQLETVLLQWLRGGGLQAMAGMAPLRRLGADAWHGRPLLEFRREDLARWAVEQGLRWQEDPSNLDLRFDRNYLRLAVLPALRQRWPAVATTAGRAAGYARDALEAEAAGVEQDLPRVLAGSALELLPLQELPEVRQRAVLRAWLAGLGLPAPSARTLAALRQDMRVAAPDRIPTVRWPGAIVRRYRGRLHAAASLDSASCAGVWLPRADARYAWSAQSTLEMLPGVGNGLSRERLPARLEVRQRTGGEAFLPAGCAHHRPLRKWLQEHDVLPWRRGSLPLLYADSRLVAVADLGVAADFAARPDEPSWRIAWNFRGPLTEGDVLTSQWPARPPIG
jgi:tRNA(Ile)-lysidine synthase